MTKIKLSKYKISRRVGVSLWGSPKDAVHKRNYRPGQHGKGLVRKVSDYKKQCSAQRMMREYYAMQEKQFRRFFDIAYKSTGNTSDNFVGILESRLASVVYNSGFVPTVFSARQVVSHKHVTVNGNMVNCHSYITKPGDIVSLTERARDFAFVRDYTGVRSHHPDYLEVDNTRFSIKVLRIPSFSEVPYPVIMSPHLVTELYSK